MNRSERREDMYMTINTNNISTHASAQKSINYNYGARRARTADLLHAMQALSQLSYSPNKSNNPLFRERVSPRSAIL